MAHLIELLRKIILKNYVASLASLVPTYISFVHLFNMNHLTYHLPLAFIRLKTKVVSHPYNTIHALFLPVEHRSYYHDKILSIWQTALKSWLGYTTDKKVRKVNKVNVTCKNYPGSNNNQLITYYLPVCYLLRIQQYPVNTTYKIIIGFSKSVLQL